MAESGVLGVVGFLLILITTAITAIKVYTKGSGTERIIALVSFLGLCTYWVHGFLNDFLDTDKASVPFWGFMAIIVSLDVYALSKKAQAEALAENTQRVEDQAGGM